MAGPGAGAGVRRRQSRGGPARHSARAFMHGPGRAVVYQPGPAAYQRAPWQLRRYGVCGAGWGVGWGELAGAGNGAGAGAGAGPPHALDMF